MNPAQGPATVCGVFVETNDATGLATRIEPVRVGGRLKQTTPRNLTADLAFDRSAICTYY